MSPSETQEIPREFDDLVEKLGAESYATLHDLLRIPFELLGTSLETFDLGEDDGIGEEAALEASYLRCKELFCLILMEMEKQSLALEAQDTLSELRTEKKRDPPPAALTAVPEEEKEEVTVTRDLTASPLLLAPTASAIEIAASEALHPLTHEYLNLALYLKEGSLDEESLNSFHRARLEAGALVHALENETAQKLSRGIESFWPNKDSAVRELLDLGNRRFEFLPTFRKGLESLALEGSSWLFEGTFPFQTVLNALRFLHSSPKTPVSIPLPVESATLLLCFGQDKNLRGMVLRNYLNVQGLTPLEHTELSFRLLRSQHYRNLAASVDKTVPDLWVLREDASRVLDLLEKLSAGQGPRNRG